MVETSPTALHKRNNQQDILYSLSSISVQDVGNETILKNIMNNFKLFQDPSTKTINVLLQLWIY